VYLHGYGFIKFGQHYNHCLNEKKENEIISHFLKYECRNRTDNQESEKRKKGSHKFVNGVGGFRE